MTFRARFAAAALVALAACAGSVGLERLGAAMRADRDGNAARALALYGEAIDAGDLAPDTLAVAYTNRCAVRGETGDARGAVDDCTRALEITPGNAMALTNRGAAHVALGEFDEAIRDHRDAIDRAPALAIAHNNQCETRLAMGEAEAALPSCDRALDLSPHLALGHFTRGEALAALGRDREARSAFRRAWQIDPDHPAIKAKAAALAITE